MPHDPAIYRAIDPDFNMSLTAAKALAAKLLVMGFVVRSIECHPQGDGKGFGITGTVPVEEMLAAGIPADAPVHLHFRFVGLRDDEGSQNCRLIETTLGAGGYLGFQRVHDALWPGSPTAHLVFLMQQPGVAKAMDLFLNGELDHLVKPAPASGRPPGSFNVKSGTAAAESAASDASGSTGKPARKRSK
jgi:hypothetical protein